MFPSPDANYIPNPKPPYTNHIPNPETLTLAAFQTQIPFPNPDANLPR